MATSLEADSGPTLQRSTNWWGAFVIGLAGPILATGIDPPAIQALSSSFDKEGV